MYRLGFGLNTPGIWTQHVEPNSGPASQVTASPLTLFMHEGWPIPMQWHVHQQRLKPPLSSAHRAS